MVGLTCVWIVNVSDVVVQVEVNEQAAVTQGEVTGHIEFLLVVLYRTLEP
jgi:hypothetical protein